jgi:hypothetical protein
MQRLLAAFVAACLATVANAEDKIPIEDFFKLPEYANMYLSPDGQNIAALSPVNGKQNLVIVNVKTRKMKAVTGLTDRDVILAEWTARQAPRLLHRAAGRATSSSAVAGSSPWTRDGSAPRLISEGRDERNTSGRRTIFRQLLLERRLPNNSDDIIVQETVFPRWSRSRARFCVSTHGRAAGKTFPLVSPPQPRAKTGGRFQGGGARIRGREPRRRYEDLLPRFRDGAVESD